MSEISIQYYKSPVGELLVGSIGEKLCICDWRYRSMRTAIDARIQNGLKSEYLEQSTPVIEESIGQLKAYFEGERKDFNVPLLFVGSDFQKRVWSSLLQIPFGMTESYMGLARKMKKESAIRAIAAANGANAISIIVPCHRIIGSDGSLVGYAGGLPAKQSLLKLEGFDSIKGQLNLF